MGCTRVAAKRASADVFKTIFSCVGIFEHFFGNRVVVVYNGEAFEGEMEKRDQLWGERDSLGYAMNEFCFTVRKEFVEFAIGQLK